jgi:hypothetical protein
MAFKFKVKRIGIGHARGEVLRYRGPGHLILIAPSRVGKSRDVIIPAFLDWPSGVDVEQLMEQLKVETDGADFADEDEDQLPKGGGA